MVLAKLTFLDLFLLLPGEEGETGSQNSIFSFFEHILSQLYIFLLVDLLIFWELDIVGVVFVSVVFVQVLV